MSNALELMFAREPNFIMQKLEGQEAAHPNKVRLVLVAVAHTSGEHRQARRREVGQKRLFKERHEHRRVRKIHRRREL